MAYLVHGEWQMINGKWLRLVQTNAVTYLVQDQEGKQFHIRKDEVTSDDVPKKLRKPVTEESTMEITFEHIPERYVIYIDEEDIANFTNEELFGIIAKLELEIVKLQGIANKPAALLKSIDEKRRAIKQIITWMDAQRP